MAGTALRRIWGARPTTGHKRLVLLASSALGTLVVIGLVVTLARTRHEVVDPSETAEIPNLDRKPGGMNSNLELERLRRLDAEQKARQAAEDGRSFTPRMAGGTGYEPGFTPPERLVTAERVAPFIDVALPAATPVTEPRKEANNDDIEAYRAAMSGLLASWRGKSPAGTTYTDDRNSGPANAGRGRAGTRDDFAPSQAAGSAGATQTASASAQGRKRVLLPANTGVFGEVVMGGNTDQGNMPVIVQALSGPIVGMRMSGTFVGSQPSACGLPVRLDKLTLLDGRQVPVDAYLVAPNDMNTCVASRVDPHTPERVIYPVLGAFAAGVGQALGASGSVISQGPYGGYSAFRNFNASQVLGIGAGAAGSAASQIFREQAPRGRTAYLDARDQVGIMFMAPVEVPD